METTVASLLIKIRNEIGHGLLCRSTDWTIRLASSGWYGPKTAHLKVDKPVESALFTTGGGTGDRDPLKFTLADVADPPKKPGSSAVICYLFPYLRNAIRECRAFLDQECRDGRQPLNKDLADRWPVLRDATTQEFEMIRGKGGTAYACGIDILLERYPDHIERENMERKVRRRRSAKKS